MSYADEEHDQVGGMAEYYSWRGDTESHPDWYPASSSDGSTTTASSSPPSRSWSDFTRSPAQSVSTAPPRHQPSDLVGTSTGQSATSSNLDSRLRLPCEFSDIGKCNRSFAFDEDESWIDHIASDHLGYNYPSYTICWFCDEFQFDARAPEGDAPHMFYCRMQHIRDHIGMNMSVKQKRPDFYFLDHLRQNRLIDEKTFNKMKKKSELPAVEDVYSASLESRRQEIHIHTNSNSRRRGHHRR